MLVHFGGPRGSRSAEPDQTGGVLGVLAGCTPRRRSPARRDAVMPGQETLTGMPPRIARGLGTTVHAQIEDWLAGAIAAGRAAPGGRLAGEQELAGWVR